MCVHPPVYSQRQLTSLRVSCLEGLGWASAPSSSVLHVSLKSTRIFSPGGKPAAVVETLLSDRPPTTTGPAPGAAGGAGRAGLRLLLLDPYLSVQQACRAEWCRGPADPQTDTTSGFHISGHSTVATWEQCSRQGQGWAYGQGGLRQSEPEGLGQYD